MKPRVVVDVGNTRIKWGLCGEHAVEQMVSLPPEESAWKEQVKEWQLSPAENWVVAGVDPKRRDQLVGWLRDQKVPVSVLTAAKQLPLRVALEEPDKVGIDRLLNAVAILGREEPRLPAIMISVGTAVTVDWLSDKGEFAGGAIFPGFRLMAKALHDYTALLPEIELGGTEPALPAKSTVEAMRAGIRWAVRGGICAIKERLWCAGLDAPSTYITGGDESLFFQDPDMDPLDPCRWPEMTLEGVRIASARTE